MLEQKKIAIRLGTRDREVLQAERLLIDSDLCEVIGRTPASLPIGLFLNQWELIQGRLAAEADRTADARWKGALIRVFRKIETACYFADRRES